MLVKVSAALAAVALLAMAGAAQAHARLMSAQPAVDSVAPAPAQIRITFDEEFVPTFSGIVLTDASGKTVATGKSAADPKDKKTLVVPLKKKLRAGVYNVTWHVVSADTHRIQGRYSFTVQ